VSIDIVGMKAAAGAALFNSGTLAEMLVHYSRNTAQRKKKENALEFIVC
jgi:hypothetical protein